MKRILVFILCLFSMTSVVMADEKEDSLNYYVQRLSVAWNSGDYQDACLCFDNTLRLYKELAGNVSQDTVYASIAGRYAELSYQFGEYDRAIELYKEVSDICKSGNNPHPYATSLSNIASCYAKIYKYQEAIKYETFAADVIKKAYGTNHLDYAGYLNNLANHYAGLGNYKESIRFGTEVLNIRKSILGENHPHYASSLLHLSFYNLQLGNYDEAIQQSTKASEIYKTNYGEENEDYILALNFLAQSYSKRGNYNEALNLAEKVMLFRKRNNGDTHPNYATSLQDISNIYSHLGNYKEAIRLGKEAMGIRKKIFGDKDPSYAVSLSELATCYKAIGNYSEAIRLETEAVEIRKRVFGESHPSYAESLINLAGLYNRIGNYSDAVRFGTEAMEIYKKAFGEEHPSYAVSINELASIYSNLGNYSEAVKLYSKAKDILKKIVGENHSDYVITLGNLALAYSELHDYENAIRLGTDAMLARKRVLGENHPAYLSSLNNLVLCYGYIGNYDKAKEFGTEVVEIRKRILGTTHPDYVTSLYNLSQIYSLMGDYDGALKLCKESLTLCKKAFGTEHPNYAELLYSLANDYSDIGQHTESLPFFKEYLSIVRKNVLNTFSGLSANERTLFWDKYTFVFNSWIPRALTESGLSEASSILYDNSALFAKGLLLSTEQEMAKLIQESGDTEALQIFSELLQNRQILNAQYSKPIAERHINCDSLERISNNIERQLVARVKEFGDYTRNLSITWKDVQSKLNDKDIAIEFLSYREKDGEMRYAALTLCKNDTAPILMPLFVESELLEAYREDNTYQNGKADSLIWEPLIAMLEGKSHVYFSASGMLHNIGIEYLPSMEGKECYRLSSTRELVTHQPGQTIGSATLYGDIDYDATYASIGTSELSSVNDYAMNTTSDQYRGRFDYRSMRYGVSPLPGTREEIKEVSALLKPLGKPCDALTGTQASEESFKNLSGQRKSLLHISTHGFYYTDEEANNLNNHLQIMLIGDNGPTNFEDQSLLRCGLCFAGANQTLSGESQPAAGQGDGILNALEIAQTDLRGLDLVVLSACQTALGDITLGEGVFGLQRGFKKAGAQSILMSLWEVDDQVTQLFMTEFYRAWTTGQSKTAALKSAQSIIKAKYPDPRHWAAFILLDALD